MDKELHIRDVASFAAAFEGDPKNRLAQNAVTRNGIAPAAANRAALNRGIHAFSHVIQTAEATDQKKSGRCWLFAGLNALRVRAAEKMNVEAFELSQTYMMFWDKLEKANYFLESIIATVKEPLDGRLVMWLLAQPIDDGGQWDMFVNLVNKYGVVPKTLMQETHSSSASSTMNYDLEAKLRECAWRLRRDHASGATEDRLRAHKRGMLQVIYRMLAIHLGTPPAEFDWEWRDKNKQFHRHGPITPRAFFETYVGADLDAMVCLIHAPTADKPFGRTFTVQYLGNVVGGRPVTYLNVEMPVLKRAAADMIVAGWPVWFGSDVDKMFERTSGLMDADAYDFELVYGCPLAMDKAARLDFGDSRMNHAMMLTGVDLDESGRPRRWRVENSWGDKYGDKGNLSMSDRWFDDYVYEAAVDTRHLSPELHAALDMPPIVLPPWDPMGSLARSTPREGRCRRWGWSGRGNRSRCSPGPR